MNLWKQALCSRESKHKTLELWWLMLTLLQQLFPNVFHSCVVPTPSARGALERRWKQSRVYWFHTRCLEYQHQTDQPGCRQATLRPTAWLPRAKISTVDFSFTKPWDRNTARVQPVKKDIQKKHIQKESREWSLWSLRFRQLGLSGAREGGPPTKSMWHGSKEVSRGVRHSVTISAIRQNFSPKSLQWRCACERVMKDFEENWGQSKTGTIRYNQIQDRWGRDEPLCCLGLTVQCI